MGAQTSSFSSEWAPFDVLSEDFGALLWQSEVSIGINCHRGWNHGPLLWSFIKKGTNGMVQTRRSTAEKGQGHSFRQKDHGNDLLGLQRNFVDWFQRKEHHCEHRVLCFTFAQIMWHYQGEEARNVGPLSFSAPWQRSSPHSGCCQGCSEGMWLRGDRAPTLQPIFGTQWLLLLLQTKERSWGKKSDDDKEVETAVMERFADKEPEYFLKGIELLVHRCEKCVEIKGDYIEK